MSNRGVLEADFSEGGIPLATGSRISPFAARMDAPESLGIPKTNAWDFGSWIPLSYDP